VTHNMMKTGHSYKPEKRTKTAKAVAGAVRSRKKTIPTAGIPFWREEIKALGGIRFASLKQALEKLADQVLERIDASRADRAGSREFLIQLLKTNPAITAELADLLGLKTEED